MLDPTDAASDESDFGWSVALSANGATALIGSALPAWTASSVRPSQVFARVA